MSICLNFSELEAQISNKSSQYRKNVIVGFCDVISESLIVEYLACMKAGGIPVFLSHPSIKSSKEVFQSRLNNWKSLGIHSYKSSFVEEKSLEKEIENSLGISFVQLSSGTTRSQKGFGISLDTLKRQVEEYSTVCGITKDGVIVSWLPVYHDMGLITSIMIPLIVGCKVAIIPTFEWLNDYDLLIGEINKYGGTHCWLPNFAFEILSKGNCRLSAPCQFINCSEPCRKVSMDKFIKSHPLAKISCCYALAENTFAVSQGNYDGTKVNCGKVLPGTKVSICDGEIEISGNSLFDATLIDGKFVEVSKSYRTGDIGMIDDENVVILGRSKEVAKIHGKQIFLPDVDFEVSSNSLVRPGRVVACCESNDLSESLIVLFEGQKEARLDISRIIKESFDVASVVFWVPDGTLIKTSSGKFARDENLKLYKKLDRLKKKCSEFVSSNVELDTEMKSIGMIDSFSVMELHGKIAADLEMQIDWKFDFRKLDSPMSFLDSLTK